MPWKALPYERRSDKDALSAACEVNGIPAFVVIQPDGTFVTKDGRAMVTKDPTAESFPAGWLPQPFNNVNDDPSPLNEEQSLILFGEASGDNEAMKAVAEEYYEQANRDVDSMTLRFFCAPPGGITDQLRKLTSVEGEKLVLLDIPDDGGFYTCDATDITLDVVKTFLADVADKKIERKQLKK